jgi:hypothetical protein
VKFPRFTQDLFVGTLLMTTIVVLVVFAFVGWKIWDESQEHEMMEAAFKKMTAPGSAPVEEILGKYNYRFPIPSDRATAFRHETKRRMTNVMSSS